MPAAVGRKRLAFEQHAAEASPLLRFVGHGPGGMEGRGIERDSFASLEDAALEEDRLRLGIPGTVGEIRLDTRRKHDLGLGRLGTAADPHTEDRR